MLFALGFFKIVYYCSKFNLITILYNQKIPLELIKNLEILLYYYRHHVKYIRNDDVDEK